MRRLATWPEFRSRIAAQRRAMVLGCVGGVVPVVTLIAIAHFLEPYWSYAHLREVIAALLVALALVSLWIIQKGFRQNRSDLAEKENGSWGKTKKHVKRSLARKQASGKIMAGVITTMIALYSLW